MKTTALLSIAVVLAAATLTTGATATATATSALRVTFHHHEKAAATHHAPASKALTTAKKFAKLAHMKATPWDSEPSVKAAKCEDLCYLRGFYTFQEGRNCYSRPTDLCMQYKLGNVALEAVLITAECECSDGSDDSAAGSEAEGDDSGEETVELPTDA